MAAGGRNPQKSAMARAKRQARDAQDAKGEGGAAAMAERKGAGMEAKMGATAARKAAVAENKAKNEAAKEAKEKSEALRAAKEKRADEKKLKEMKAAGLVKESTGPTDQQIMDAQKKYMPIIKQGEALQEEAGLLQGGDEIQMLKKASDKYQDAITKFRGEGIKRPKLSALCASCSDCACCCS